MPKFQYTAMNLQNQKITGNLDARDIADLKRLLREKNVVFLSAKEVKKEKQTYKMKAVEISEFCRQLANMLESGITIMRALEIVKDRDFKPQIKKVYEKLYQDVEQGNTLAESMRMQGKTFPELLINMFASGEASGQLENAAYKMADNYEKEHRLNRKVQAAMTYPMILLVVTILVVFGLFTIILPQFFDVFISMDVPLPMITQVVMGISDFLINNILIVLIFMVILAIAIKEILGIYSVALKMDKLKLRLPVLGNLFKIIYTARFSRTLSSLYSSGLSMISALEIASTILGNKYISAQFPAFIKNVRNGESLSDVIKSCDGFDNKLAITIMIGEESGKLYSMLSTIAEGYDYEAEMATARMVQLIEPVMLILMAVIVGAVMLSVFMPLMSLYSNMGTSL